MRLGLSTPGVIQMPGVAAGWEAGLTPADLATVARAADELGYDYLTCAEHVAVPVAERARRGDVYWDPVATLSYLAAHTSRIRLATSVVVLGYHHPLQIAKSYGTVDVLSGGRLVLGVGVGSLQPEFELLGAAFEDRGARADDALRALRACLSESEPAYDGEYYAFSGMSVRPCAVQSHVPIWVGGRTRRSLRRAVALADGWMPFGLAPDALQTMLRSVDLPDGFEVVLSTTALDPAADPKRARTQLRALRAVGATAVTCTVSAVSAEHYCEQLAALRGLAQELEGDPA
ncbi:LLM class F420-dependent oxidoreductase [Mycobacterium sp. ACS4331]|uniref:LLM class F420-dependent oxidoreductase n=1 Tax=Mycobacterium sp. ACS4331 TaxID=1834121 RepID=UPI00080189B8|nr:LLM class F420-dependent oxidoreductase [Mycobacterium sp. ACS4331]OBF21174.1 LLM class F420-dependent oxidoreductase [Mycobacterium sp. ACS4331]